MNPRPHGPPSGRTHRPSGRQTNLLGAHLWLALLAALLLTGCVNRPVVVEGQMRVDEMADTHRAFGQTFVAEHDGLSGVELVLQAVGEVSDPLTVTLRRDAADPDVLAQVILDPSQIVRPGWQRLSFPPIPDSAGQRYYVSAEGIQQPLLIGISHVPTYHNGSGYEAHLPTTAQTAFQLNYSPAVAVWGALLWILRGLPGALLLGLAYLLPGWGILLWLLPRRDTPYSGAEFLGLTLGVSMAVYPIWLFWTGALGLSLGIGNGLGPSALGLLLGLAAMWRGRTHPRERIAVGRLLDDWPGRAFLGLALLVLIGRLYVIRPLDAPLWGDSVQHGAIVQLLLDHGGLFQSWHPYYPYESLTVHFGFHVLAALTGWLVGLDGTAATLVGGQIVNALAVVTLAPLAVRVAGGNRWAAAWVVLVAGLWSQHPAYYVNWGRYPQLAGQAILPVALYFLWQIGDSGGFNWRRILLGGLTLAGMTLSYYRMPIYYGAFGVTWLVLWLLPRWRLQGRQWAIGAGEALLLGVVAALLAGPWLANLASSQLSEIAATPGEELPLAQLIWSDYQIWRNLDGYLSRPLQGAALLALLAATVFRRAEVWVMALWGALLAGLLSLALLQVPLVHTMQSFAVIIFLYVPVSIMVGWLAAELISRGTGALSAYLGSGGRVDVLVSVSVLLIGAIAGIRQLSIVEPANIMVTRPDSLTMQWIRRHTPEDALFLAEGFRIWNGTSLVGADAGWWLPLLAHRSNTVPPQYALTSERPSVPGYGEEMRRLMTRLENTSLAQTESVDLLCEYEITHVYVGQGEGRVGLDAQPLFTAEEALANPKLILLHRLDQAYVFGLRPDACS